MNNLKNFKSVADEIMKDITVSNEIKEKTLSKCRKESNKRVSKARLIPSTCFGVILLLMFIFGRSIKPWNANDDISKSNIENASTMLVPDSSTLQTNQNGKETVPPGPVVSSNIKTLDEAKKYLNVDVLEPSYLPTGFNFKEIQGISNNDKEARNLWIEYGSQDRMFVISFEGNGELTSFEGYKEVDINGIKGYIRSFKDSLTESTELRWFIGENLYAIEGAISEDEAVRVARSLK